MKKNLTTPVGQTDNNTGEHRINAINQVFALFRRNYHNQYFRAWADENELSVTKRLWLDALKKFSPETILQAARSVVETCEFLPTLHTMIRHCQDLQHHNLPDAHNAYIEACRAPSPKANYAWSHPAVYYAGKNCDWLFIQSNNESVAFPVFKREYERLCEQVRQGEILSSPQKTALPENLEKPLDKSSNLEHLESLRKNLNL